MSSSLANAPVVPQSTSLDTTVVTSWKAPIAFGVFTLVLLAFAVFAPRSGGATTTYRLSTANDVIQLPELTVPAMPALWTVVVLLGLVTAYSAWLVSQKRRELGGR